MQKLCTLYSNQNEAERALLGHCSRRFNSIHATRAAIASLRVLTSRSVVPIADGMTLEAYGWVGTSDVKDLLLGDVADALIAAVTSAF
jgi:hypothetical protein